MEINFFLLGFVIGASVVMVAFIIALFYDDD